ACVRSNTSGCTSVRASSSNAAVRPTGPAPAITAIFLWDIELGRRRWEAAKRPASAHKTLFASSEQQYGRPIQQRCTAVAFIVATTRDPGNSPSSETDPAVTVATSG